MDKDPGRDIGPDETRARPLPSTDLQMDLSIEPMDEESEDNHQYHSIYSSSQENNISSMPPGYTQHRVYGTDRVMWTQFIEEPLDMTPADSNPIGHDAFPEPTNILANNPLMDEFVRLQTFSGHWPHHAPVSPKDLAKNGFYYLGPEDRVRCVHCAGVLKNWAPGDTVEDEHRTHYPQCLMNRPSGSASSSASSMPHSDSLGILPKCSENGVKPPREDLGIVKSNPKYPRYAIESDRLKTFKLWPTQMKQKPDDLARAGLFYLGKGDKVKCYMCDGTLHSWEPDDDPMSEHARWFPDCAFVKLSREDNSCSQNGVTVADTESTHAQTSASVQALIDNGYSLEAISEAINKLHIDGVDENVIPAAEEILNTILDTDGEQSGGRGETNPGLQNGDGQTDKEVKALLDENRELKEQRLCKICLEDEISVIFLPCGHLSCCRQCGTSLSECPICRTAIKGTAKAFWA